MRTPEGSKAERGADQASLAAAWQLLPVRCCCRCCCCLPPGNLTVRDHSGPRATHLVPLQDVHYGGVDAIKICKHLVHAGTGHMADGGLPLRAHA